MGKKRRTRQQKIIARLKRELKSVKTIKAVTPVKTIKSVPANHQPAQDPRPNVGIKTVTSGKKSVAFAYEPKLIKKDLIKTLLLSIIFIIIIIVIKVSFRL